MTPTMECSVQYSYIQNNKYILKLTTVLLYTPLGHGMRTYFIYLYF